jgi:hypothetical protein
MVSDDADQFQAKLNLIRHLKDKLAQAMAMSSCKKDSGNESSFSSANANLIHVPKPQRHVFSEMMEESIAPREISK